MRAHALFTALVLAPLANAIAQEVPAQPERVPDPNAWVWPSEPPADYPFKLSKDILGLAFTGAHSDYHVADTWYPSWASNDTLYSPWTDGTTDGMSSWSFRRGGGRAVTGHGVLIGDDPVNLQIEALGTFPGSPEPYAGRYPSASLVYNGVWYYGTYCVGPTLFVAHEGRLWGWHILGPMAGFRTSTDFGRTWTASPHSCADGLFPEPAEHLGPVKMGVPHFVDFGKNMEHSPDGKAYLVATGAEIDDPDPRYANLSWVTGDQIYLARVTPSLESINDVSQYEFFAGHTDAGEPLWTSTFSEIEPIVDWNNNAGNAAITYNAPLKKYLLAVTDGWPTTAKMNSYILESDDITGPYKLVTYMRDFGEQAYFLNFPSKFISEDGRTAWLCYSSNFTSTVPDGSEVFGVNLEEDPPGSHYGLVLQEVWLLDEEMLKRTGPRRR